MFLVSLAHFPRFCWRYFSLSNAFSIHLARKTYFLLCSGFWNLQNLTFQYCCFAYKIKSRRRLLKTMAIFLNFVVKTAPIWLILAGFFWVFSESETICNLHSCYKFAFVLQKNCTPFSANQNWVFFSCILLVLKNCEILHSVWGLYDK